MKKFLLLLIIPFILFSQTNEKITSEKIGEQIWKMRSEIKQLKKEISKIKKFDLSILSDEEKIRRESLVKEMEKSVQEYEINIQKMEDIRLNMIAFEATEEVLKRDADEFRKTNEFKYLVGGFLLVLALLIIQSRKKKKPTN